MSQHTVAVASRLAEIERASVESDPQVLVGFAERMGISTLDAVREALACRERLLARDVRRGAGYRPARPRARRAS
jgi:hypothetical protein